MGSSLLSRIKTLEMELAVLKAEVKRMGEAPKTGSFADLYGIFAGKMSATEEDFAEAEYSFEWEGEEMR